MWNQEFLNRKLFSADIPCVFVDTTFNFRPEKTDFMLQKQADQTETLARFIFNRSRRPFLCDEKCKSISSLRREKVKLTALKNITVWL